MLLVVFTLWWSTTPLRVRRLTPTPIQPPGSGPAHEVPLHAPAVACVAHSDDSVLARSSCRRALGLTLSARGPCSSSLAIRSALASLCDSRGTPDRGMAPTSGRVATGRSSARSCQRSAVRSLPTGCRRRHAAGVDRGSRRRHSTKTETTSSITLIPCRDVSSPVASDESNPASGGADRDAEQLGEHR